MGLEPCPMTLFNLNYLLKGPVSMYNHIGDWSFNIWKLCVGGGRTIQSIKTHNASLSSLKKEGDADTSYNVDKTSGRYAKWNKPVTKMTALLWDS